MCFRVEEVPLRHFLTVWSDPGHSGNEDPEDEGPGICDFQRDQLCSQCSAIHARIPFL